MNADKCFENGETKIKDYLRQSALYLRASAFPPPATCHLRPIFIHIGEPLLMALIWNTPP